MTTKPFTGRRMAAILIAFFGVVVGVNFTLATLATRTFGGVVVQNSYVASQKYNQWLAQAKRQDELGWKVTAALDAERRVGLAISVSGTQVRGFARHPLGRAKDIPLEFDAAPEGQLRSDQALPAGRWLVHLLVQKDGNKARLIEELS